MLVSTGASEPSRVRRKSEALTGHDIIVMDPRNCIAQNRGERLRAWRQQVCGVNRFVNTDVQIVIANIRLQRAGLEALTLTVGDEPIVSGKLELADAAEGKRRFCVIIGWAFGAHDLIARLEIAACIRIRGEHTPRMDEVGRLVQCDTQRWSPFALPDIGVLGRARRDAPAPESNANAKIANNKRALAEYIEA